MIRLAIMTILATITILMILMILVDSDDDSDDSDWIQRRDSENKNVKRWRRLEGSRKETAGSS